MTFYASDETINITDSLHEHGHVWSAIQENYIDAIDDNSDKITQALSDADFYDVNMYKGNWETMPFFALNAIKIPKIYFTKKLYPEDIRPGKFWTKFGNQKMRQQKIRNIQVHLLLILNTKSLCYLECMHKWETFLNLKSII